MSVEEMQTQTHFKIASWINFLVAIERGSRYVTLQWQQNFWISTIRGPANMAKQKTKKKKIDMTV